MRMRDVEGEHVSNEQPQLVRPLACIQLFHVLKYVHGAAGAAHTRPLLPPLPVLPLRLIHFASFLLAPFGDWSLIHGVA